MNILVLGGSSAIGSSIAAAFAPGNGIRLAGRNGAALHKAGDLCLTGGASSVEYSECDLSQGIARLLDELRNWPVDLVINAASGSSRTRDSAIPIERMREIAEVDLLAPLDLIVALARRNTKPPRVVFVSSVLAQVRSPNRAVYGLFKAVHEQSLRRLESAVPGLEVMIVRIGKALPVERITADTRRLADAVLSAFQKRRKTVFFGMAGRALAALYYAQLLLFEMAVGLRRIAVSRRGRKESQMSGEAEPIRQP